MDRSDAQGVFMALQEDVDFSYEEGKSPQDTYRDVFQQNLTFKPDREYNQMGAVIQICTMHYKGVEFGYERSYLPKHWAKSPTYTCYPNNVFYDETEANELAGKFGAQAFPDPYDDTAWYLSFQGEERYANMERFYVEYAQHQKTTRVPDEG